MGPGPAGPIVNGHVHAHASRRRPPQYPSLQHQHQHSYHQQHVNHGHMYYSSPMNPYANSYYPQVQVPPHYQNGTIPAAPYIPYNAYQQHQPARSPPTMHQHQQYPPIVSSNMQPPPPPQSYSRPPPQPSPAMSTPPPFPTAVPPPPVPIPQTPVSSHSSQAVTASLTPPTPQSQVATSQSEVEVTPARIPFRAPLPWLSRPELPFPAKSNKARRRRRIMSSENGQVELPIIQPNGVQPVDESPIQNQPAETPAPDTPTQTNTGGSAEPAERPETPSTQNITSECAESTSPSTPVSVHTAQTTTADSVTPTKPSKPTPRAAKPAVPIALPVLPKASPKDTRSTAGIDKLAADQKQAVPPATSDKAAGAQTSAEATQSAETEAKAEVASASVKVAPKNWAGLFAKTVPAAAAAPGVNGVGASSVTNGGSSAEAVAAGNGGAASVGFAKANASSLAEALRSYRVTGDSKIAFLEPRGLINTGNMCYMNSVLQVLIFCIPFYDFLDQVSKKAAYSFKSETPLIDAMVMFMREFKIIDSAVSVDLLRRRLKNEELEQYGEPFIPEFVYEAIKKLPRFASMRRGHQQDAEEFLGFLLETLQDECSLIMRHLPDSSLTTTTAANSSVVTPTVSSPTSIVDTSDWLEVGPRQRAAITRSSGQATLSSPITRIFGGQWRSELKVPGCKDSVTLQPFQSLQLDISSPQVHNIVDALKNLTRPEILYGDFHSPRGKDATATKQVSIESLPSVLILHLKRFQYVNAEGGTVKIWKQVGYPLELELPKEVISRQKKASLSAEGAGFPKYRLIAAVYHHGKNASGGHYTVDVRRQDGKEWIRLDDTVIRRVRSEDVAEGGVEEDVSKQNESKDIGGSANRFDSIGEEEGWNKVSAPTGGAKKWSSVVNGAASKPVAAPKGKQVKDNMKDNKVAYLLFYQRI
ncbi:uncharacterized protein BCR38DRAFT_341350 [Pseudomassariella vexata]|uniref:ubiquitinyl hydrolase 1 n=1 Tax=Pseudomassariella vexata TaxID=1141098 RepID=A0A1Y2E170_9PEZI|nr:uncharacterized protein BCR38DRAFT_341350 [Pseudomassariella vexata]ORY65280.1 hypothetical protein BCR38DRAFT_341350 [Pseudomassariella vexata]